MCHKVVSWIHQCFYLVICLRHVLLKCCLCCQPLIHTLTDLKIGRFNHSLMNCDPTFHLACLTFYLCGSNILTFIPFLFLIWKSCEDSVPHFVGEYWVGKLFFFCCSLYELASAPTIPPLPSPCHRSLSAILCTHLPQTSLMKYELFSSYEWNSLVLYSILSRVATGQGSHRKVREFKFGHGKWHKDD